MFVLDSLRGLLFSFLVVTSKHLFNATSEERSSGIGVPRLLNIVTTNEKSVQHNLQLYSLCLTGCYEREGFSLFPYSFSSND
jgi:hypothetical protein